MFNTRKKSILSFLLILVFALVMVGCVDTADDNDDEKYRIEELDTKFTDDLKLESSFEGKRFVESGIEEVSLHLNIDGDTTHFLDKSGDIIKIRYLGINTPESTGKIAPWGRQASVFVKDKLTSANSIVIEANVVGTPPETDTTGGRYLGYVWYQAKEGDDYRLLNIEIIENCFSYFTGEPESLKYGSQMRDAYLDKSSKVDENGAKFRVFGAKDPNFDYDTTVREITIAELRNEYSSYSTGTKLKIKARVVRLVGNSLFIEDVDETINKDTNEKTKSGIYLYHSFVDGIGKFKPGQVISFECQASDAEGQYGIQLVGASKLRLVESSSEYEITKIGNDVTSLKEYEGFVVSVEGFTVTRVGNVSDTGAYTIYGTMANGSELLVRVDGSASPKLSPSYVEVGKVYNVIGGVSRYTNPFEDNKVYYQIMLGNLIYDGNKDFIKVDNN